jgi:putative copper export protein
MAQQETLLEMAQRHVAAGEARVTQQTALVAELARDGHNTSRAEAQLTILKDTLHLMCELLARERERESKARRRVRRW